MSPNLLLAPSSVAAGIGPVAVETAEGPALSAGSLSAPPPPSPSGITIDQGAALAFAVVLVLIALLLRWCWERRDREPEREPAEVLDIRPALERSSRKKQD